MLAKGIFAQNKVCTFCPSRTVCWNSDLEPVCVKEKLQ